MSPLALQLAALDEDKVSPGLLGFTVVAVLAVATWLLLKSMTRQLKRVDFEEKDIRGGGGLGGGRTDGPDGSSGPVGVEADAETHETGSETGGRQDKRGPGAGAAVSAGSRDGDDTDTPDAAPTADDRPIRGETRREPQDDGAVR